jgi:hypothetical protein
MAFGFCGVVVLLFVRELGERVLPPQRWMRLRLCADLLCAGSVVLCSGSDVCGSRAVRCRSQLLRSGSCGRSQLLRSGSGCS